MSDSEEENFCFFGKPLEPYDEDAFPKKKPIQLEDQVATDSHGRRRFHGAFTGGFSAGFFNTVGSLEGWTPSEFRSTRQDKASAKSQKPEDFMDDEDVGEFGIAPQTVKATKEYSTSKKRKRKVFSDGPIPGEPVLHSILTSGNETIGYILLKNMGLKARKQEQEQAEPNENRTYGCEMPRNYEISRHEELNNYEIPEIYKEFLQKPKINTFGLGYVGLDKSHINLFQSSKLVINERNKKKLSISGQAFGVGAFEEDDEDIYVKEDMTKYDFELTSEKQSKKLKNHQQLVFDEFVPSKFNLVPKEFFAPPTIPQSFTGKHKVKRSRFEPLPSEEKPEVLPERKKMDADVRRNILGEPPKSLPEKVVTPIKVEEVPKQKSEDKPNNSLSDLSTSIPGLVFDRFVSASQPEDPSNILEEVKRMETSHGTEEMRAAVKMKMFGPLTRISFDWQPCSILCKRFNVPEPKFELDGTKSRKRTKNLIFQYQEHAEAPWTLKPGLSTTTLPTSTPNESIAETPESAEVVENDTKTENDEVTVVEEKEVSTTEKPAEEIVDLTEKTKDEEKKTSTDITEKIGIENNQDLYKAIFLSDTESEDEEENKEEESKEEASKQEELKANVLSDTLLPKIQPLKEGILSNMDFSIFNQKPPDSTPKTEEASADVDSDLYGPQLPKDTSNLSKSVISVEVMDDDEWVEKNDSEESDDSSDSEVEAKKSKPKKKKKKSHKKKDRKKHKKHKKKR